MSFGFSFGLPSWKTLSGGFTPASLFTGGENGVWYEPSPTNGTLFTDSAGTTPVTGVEQFVGLMLDKSKGLVLGPELVTNGSGSSTTGWDVGTGLSSLTSVNGEFVATANGGISSQFSRLVTLEVGKWYQCSVTVRSPSSNSVTNLGRLKVEGGLTANLAVQVSQEDTNVTLSGYVLATSTSARIYVSVQTAAVWGGNGDVLYASNVSIKSIAGNHAFQTNSTKRPKLAARYNLLTYSEQFDNGAWTKSRGTITSTTESAPNSTNTACVLTQSAGQTLLPLISRSLSSVPANLDLVFSGYVKQGTKPFAAIGTDAPSAVGLNQYSYFEFATQTVTKNASITSLVFTSVGNGWYRFELVTTTRASVGNVTVLIGSSNSASTNVTDDQKTIIIWGADLRPASQATGLIGPTYQRVAAATVYDTAGFLPYLEFDGLSWSMSTNSIDFSAGDKMTVWAGVRKLSDATYGALTELGNWGTNVNGFAFAAPGSSAPNYSMALLVTSGNYPTNRYTTYSSPITNVLQGSFDRAKTTIATQIVGRINGLNVTASSTVSAPVAASNFGNYPLYIGMRNNASFPFTGWLTSLIVRGAQSTQSQIEATEAWVNSRTGAY